MRIVISIFIFALSFSVLSASPLQKEIDSAKSLRTLGIIVRSQQGEKTVSFEITWKPRSIDKDFPPRLDMFLDDRKAGQAKLQVRYSINDKGVCHADFTLRSDQLSQVKLMFRESQQFEHTLELLDYMEGFRRFEDSDPLAK